VTPRRLDTKCLVLSERWVDRGKSRLRVKDVAIWPYQHGKCVQLWDDAMSDTTLRVSIAFRESGQPSRQGVNFYGWRNVNHSERATIDRWRDGGYYPAPKRKA
jgi:hypothetical protein